MEAGSDDEALVHAEVQRSLGKKKV